MENTTTPKFEAKPLNVEFFNLGWERHIEPELDITRYHRVERAWNIYFHGFCDRYDDIAYVKQKDLLVEPGIYEVTTYGESVYLFLWDTEDGTHRPYKGLLVRKDDQSGVADAYQKYSTQQKFI